MNVKLSIYSFRDLRHLSTFKFCTIWKMDFKCQDFAPCGDWYCFNGEKNFNIQNIRAYCISHTTGWNKLNWNSKNIRKLELIYKMHLNVMVKV